MIGTLLTVHMAAAYGLGGYNIAKFFAIKAIRARRARKAERTRDEKLNKVVEYGEGVLSRFKTGDLDLSKIKAVLDVIEQAKLAPAAVK